MSRLQQLKMNRDADGRATVEWPDEARGCLISRDLLDQMIEEANERTWVRVDERLPDDCTECLVVSNRHVQLAHYTTKYGWAFCDDSLEKFDQNVTHWMKMPEPPVVMSRADEAMLRSENAMLRDELASATLHMEMAEAAWLRETSGNSPVAVTLTADELAAIENAKTFATNEQTYCVLKKLLERVAGPQLR